MMAHQKNAARLVGQHFFVLFLLVFFLLGCSPQTSPESPSDGILQVVFIDVGQGDSTLLISPSGRSLLVDCGKGQAYGAVAAQLRTHGIRAPDVIVGTHPHDDHVGALPGILKNMGTKELYLNGRDDGSRLYAAILREAGVRNLMIQPLIAGDVLNWDPDVSVEVLAPRDPNRTNVNDSSIILKVTYGVHSFLLTGDAEELEEAELVRHDEKRLSSNVVKVPHHGSATSSTHTFVAAVQADVAIVSTGVNAFGHPHDMVLKRWADSGAEVYTTKEHGTLVLESDGQTLWLSKTKKAA